MAKKKKEDLQVWTLPEEMVIPLLAAWRLLERGINPAFDFLMRCNKCGEMGAESVQSVKNDGSFIGIRCKTEGCGQVVKFGRPMSVEDSDMPERLKTSPKSVLIPPDGGEPVSVASEEWVAETFKFVIGEAGD